MNNTPKKKTYQNWLEDYKKPNLFKLKNLKNEIKTNFNINGMYNRFKVHA